MVELTIVLTVAGVALLVWALRRSEAWLRRRGQAFFWRDVAAELAKAEREKAAAAIVLEGTRASLTRALDERLSVTKERDEARQELERQAQAAYQRLEQRSRAVVDDGRLERAAREVVELEAIGRAPHMKVMPYGPVPLGAAEHAARLENAIEALRAALA